MNIPAMTSDGPVRHGRSRIARVVGLVLGGLVASGVASCQSFRTLCEEQIDCGGGNDADIDACVVDADATADQASLYGCSEWFDLMLACFEEEAECKNKVYAPTGTKCEEEFTDYSHCMGN